MADGDGREHSNSISVEGVEMSGGKLTDYKVMKAIGKGKFSTVYRASKLDDGSLCALKKIAIFDMMDAKSREKTLKEVRLVQQLAHPNIIKYLDSFFDQVSENA